MCVCVCVCVCVPRSPLIKGPVTFSFIGFPVSPAVFTVRTTEKTQKMLKKHKSSTWNLMGSVDYVAKFKDTIRVYRNPSYRKYLDIDEKENKALVKALGDSFKHVSREASIDDLVLCMDLLMSKWAELFEIHQKDIIRTARTPNLPGDFRDMRSIINAKSKRKMKTCLHKQVECSNLLRVVLLVSKCAGLIDLEAKDSANETPLQVAERIGKKAKSDSDASKIYRFLRKISKVDQSEESMADFNQVVFSYAIEALSRDGFGTKLCNAASSSQSAEIFRKTCAKLAHSLYDLCPFAHMINEVARSGEFVKMTALEVALMRKKTDNEDSRMAREDIMKWLLLHGSRPNLVKAKVLREEATAEWQNLWKNGAFSVEKEVEKKEIQKTQIKERNRRRASMLLPSPPSKSTESSQETTDRRSTSEVLADMGLDDNDILVREDEEEEKRNENDDENNIQEEKQDVDDTDDQELVPQTKDFTSLQSRGHNLPPGILIDCASPPGLSTETTLEHMINNRVPDTYTRDEMLLALHSLTRKNQEIVERLKRDRDEIRSQLLSITKQDREKMFYVLEESDMNDDEKDLPIWKRIVRLSSKYVRMASNRASTTEREKRDEIKTYFDTLREKLARLEEDRFRAKRVYALQVSKHVG